MRDLAGLVEGGIEAVGAVRGVRGEDGVCGCFGKVVRRVRLISDADRAGIGGAGERFAARTDGRWVRTGI